MMHTTIAIKVTRTTNPPTPAMIPIRVGPKTIPSGDAESLSDTAMRDDDDDAVTPMAEVVVVAETRALVSCAGTSH